MWPFTRRKKLKELESQLAVANRSVRTSLRYSVGLEISLGDRIGKLEAAAGLRHDRLVRLEKQVKFLTDCQEPNCSIAIMTPEEVETARAARENLAREAAEAKAKISPPVKCKMALIKRGDPKPPLPQPSLARRIVNYLVRIGVDEWVLTQDVKANLLGSNAVSQGGGHFTRTLHRLEDLGLIRVDWIDGEDSVSLTMRGAESRELMWFTLKDYKKAIESE